MQEPLPEQDTSKKKRLKNMQLSDKEILEKIQTVEQKTENLRDWHRCKSRQYLQRYCDAVTQC